MVSNQSQSDFNQRVRPRDQPASSGWGWPKIRSAMNCYRPASCMIVTSAGPLASTFLIEAHEKLARHLLDYKAPGINPNFIGHQIWGSLSQIHSNFAGEHTPETIARIVLFFAG